MKKFLHKSCAWLVMLVAMFAMSMSAWAQTTKTFTLPADENKDDFVFSGGLQWYGAYWVGNALEIQAPEGATMTQIAITDDSSWRVGSELTCDPGSFSAQSLGSHTWVGEANKVTIYPGYSSWAPKTIVITYTEATIDPINYAISFVGEIPAGCSATLDGETYTENSNFTIAKKYKETDLNVTTTEDYYADVTYDADNHTWTVAFKPWFVYTVEITIPSNNPYAGVMCQGDYYENGETFKSKTALTDSDFEVSDLNGYDESVTVEGNVVKVVYTESAPMEYTITLMEAPTGASVTVKDETFTEEGEHKYSTPYVLDQNDFHVTAPEGWYYESNYNAATRVFYVEFLEYTHYSVVVAGTEDENAGVVYNWTTYHNGETLHGKNLTASSVSAAKVSGLEGSVALDGTTFTVTYTKPEYISFDTSNVGSSINITQDGVTLTATGWRSKLDLYSGQPVTISSVEYDIEKIVFVYDYSLPSMTVSSGNFDPSTGTWTCSEATKTVTLTYNGFSDYLIDEVRVWVKEPEPVPAPEFPVQGKAYAIKNADSNLYLNLVESADKGTVLGNAPEALYFTWDAMKAGFTITNEEGLYAGGHTNTWNMASNVAEYWTVVEDAGLYYIKCSKGYMGFDGTNVGDAAFRNKGFGSMIAFTLEDYVAPLSGTFEMSDAGWTTFCATEAVEVPAGYTAYIVTAVDGETGTLTTKAIEPATATDSKKFDADDDAINNNALSNGTITVSADGLSLYDGGGWYPSEYFILGEGDHTMTISAPEGCEITRISFDADGSYTSPTWPDGSNGNSYVPAAGTNEVEVSMTAYYDYVYFYGITVEYTVSGTKVILPAYTGVLLEGPADGAVAFEQSYETPNAVTGNLLVGCTEDATWNAPGTTYYKFSLDADNTAGSAGFYWGVDGGASIEAHAGKAYLVLDTPAASNSRYLINGLGDLTGIDTVLSSEASSIYNLQGQRVLNAKSGIYVKNGRKVIVK